jgi:hypothetical protein
VVNRRHSCAQFVFLGNIAIGVGSLSVVLGSSPGSQIAPRARAMAFVWYVRRAHGARIRLKAEYDSAAFWSEYREAMEGAKPERDMKAHTLARGLDRYRNSSAWAGLSNATRRQRENIYRSVIATAGAAALTSRRTPSRPGVTHADRRPTLRTTSSRRCADSSNGRPATASSLRSIRPSA